MPDSKAFILFISNAPCFYLMIREVRFEILRKSFCAGHFETDANNWNINWTVQNETTFTIILSK